MVYSCVKEQDPITLIKEEKQSYIMLIGKSITLKSIKADI